MSTPLPEFIDSLLRTGGLEGREQQVDLTQTHISYILLTGDRVYKIKKPVNFGFLDFSTPALRKYYCEQELVLNRRLCPDIYLDVVTITEKDGRFYLGEETGRAVDWAVKMVRMPEERMMYRLLSGGQFDRDMLDRIVATLVPFYEKQPSGGNLQPYGSIEAVEARVEDNLAQIRPFIGKDVLTGDQYNIIQNYVDEFLKKEELFERRSRDRIRDCHGDLYSANICIDEKVHIFDCIEFNENFRIIDVASDVAFLAMDLDYHGLSEFSDYFIDSFVQASGDFSLREVLDFYKCYRAAVRGKIGLLTADSSEISEDLRHQSLNKAQKYFELAVSYAS
ncbi:MAG: hypothetical protein ACLFV2_11255 [Desulfurivibrionaceae bacterium]